ncbi:hypothetical protein [Agromyces sp. NPDC055661]|jgi:hypothetical protein
MPEPTNADLRPRPATAEPVDFTPPAWWQLTGNDIEDAGFLIDRWLDRELELGQLPLDAITLAAEQVQDVRIAVLEKATETTWPELIASAFLGFMTNSPYGGMIIQAITARALHALANTSALQKASRTFAKDSKIEFFAYAGKVYEYQPAAGSIKPVSTQKIASLLESLEEDLVTGTDRPIDKAIASSSFQGVSEGLSQSGVTLAQGAPGPRPSPLPAGDSPGVTLLDQCMAHTAALRHASRSTAAALTAMVRARKVSVAEVAAQASIPKVPEDLGAYRRTARLLVEALIWVKLAPVTFTGISISPSRFRVDASPKLVAYWTERFGPLVAESRSEHPREQGTTYARQWAERNARLDQYTKAADASWGPSSWADRAAAAGAQSDVKDTVLSWMEHLGTRFDQELKKVVRLRPPPK